MNYEFLMDATDGKIFKVMAELTDKLLSKRMDIVVQQGEMKSQAIARARMGWGLTACEVSSVFFSRAQELADSADKGIFDLFEYCQSTVSDAMVVLLLGKVKSREQGRFPRPEKLTGA